VGTRHTSAFFIQEDLDVRITPQFTVPMGSDKRNAQEAKHIETAIELLKNATATSEVRLTVGIATVKELKQELATLKHRLKVNLTQNERKDPKIHCKLLLVSAVGGTMPRKHVVFTGSGNYSYPDANKHQNAVLVEDRSLYKFYRDEVIPHIQNSTIPKNPLVKTVGPVKAYVFPLRRPEDDWVSKAFRNMGAGVLDIAMARWQDANKGGRGLRLAKELKSQLAAQGQLKVRILLRKGYCPERILSVLQSARELVGKRLEVYMLDKAKYNFHDKYFIFAGTYNGQANSFVVFTGSENFTGKALTGNFEVMWRISDENIYNAFRKDFNGLLKVWKFLTLPRIRFPRPRFPW